MLLIKNKLVRLLVMFLCIIITAATLNQFAKLIQHLITIRYDWRFELCMVIGQLIFQYPFIYKRSIDEKLDYYFNMLLVSCIGSLLLLPLIIANHFYLLSNTMNILFFFCVVLYMFFEHRRRVKGLRMPFYISYTWVLYRFLLLIFILI